MSEYSIRELEKLSGIKAHTIRIWEKRYNLISPKRTSTNIRFYSDEDLKKILNISMLNRNGLKISKIAGMNRDELTNQVSVVAGDIWSFETQIESLLLATIDLDEKMFEKILSKCIIQMGFEDTIINVVYPFLNRIGILWQTGNINPAQEHFISNLIRQKLIVAIDGIILRDNHDCKKFILFLPDGELHEIALLFIYYLIKKRGHKAIYLGQSVPMDDVRSVYDVFEPDYLVTYFTASIQFKDLQNRIKEYHELFSDAKLLKLILAGNQVELLDIKTEKSNIFKMSNTNDLIQFLHSIRVLAN